jgi:hypothetical protein
VGDRNKAAIDLSTIAKLHKRKESMNESSEVANPK